MCNVCCREFRGWCKAFTRTERLLTILECILLVVFISFLAFLILHLTACTQHEISYGSTTVPVEFTHHVTVSPRSTLGPDVKCTWEPSKKTKATTHYYEYGLPPIPTTTKMGDHALRREDETDAEQGETAKGLFTTDFNEEMAGVEESDGEVPEAGFDKFVIALVKVKPMREITFGCILTIVSEYWALTAASCIESVEEVDSLDSYVMLEGYGAEGAAARAHAVGAVRVHPLYGGANRSYDLAALRSDDRLPTGPWGYLRLPTMLDYLLHTVGERLTILGYGRFRTIDRSASGRALHEVHVYSLPARACGSAAQAEAWAPRHLSRPAPLRARACGAGGACGVCAGTLHARGVPCNYCAGTPLLRAARLLGLMADNQQCGVACEPARYVNLAAMRDWLDPLLSSDEIS